MEDRILNEIKYSFTNFSGEITHIIDILTRSPQAFNSNVWSIIVSIYNILLPVGYSMLALFFIIDFLNKSVMFEWTKWENVVKVMLKVVVAKFIMENSFMLLNAIFQIVSTMINSTAGVTTMVEPWSMDYERLTYEIKNMDMLEQWGFFASIIPWTIAMKAIRIAIFVIVYGRMFELYIMTAISPLPLATLAGEGTQNVAKKFFQTYLAVCLQGLVIFIGCMIYGAMMSSIEMTGDMWKVIMNVVLTSVVLLIIFIKSGSWARQLTGAM